MCNGLAGARFLLASRSGPQRPHSCGWSFVVTGRNVSLGFGRYIRVRQDANGRPVSFEGLRAFCPGIVNVADAKPREGLTVAVDRAVQIGGGLQFRERRI